MRCVETKPSHGFHQTWVGVSRITLLILYKILVRCHYPIRVNLRVEGSDRLGRDATIGTFKKRPKNDQDFRIASIHFTWNRLMDAFQNTILFYTHARRDRVRLTSHVVQKLVCASSAKQISDVSTDKLEDIVQILRVRKIVLSIDEPLVVKYLNDERTMRWVGLSRYEIIEARKVACRYEWRVSIFCHDGANKRQPRARPRDCKTLEELTNAERW